MNSFLLCYLLFFLAAFGIIGTVNTVECQSRWSQSGFHAQWGPIQGCRISKDGRIWIPEENYRGIP